MDAPFGPGRVGGGDREGGARSPVPTAGDVHDNGGRGNIVGPCRQLCHSLRTGCVSPPVEELLERRRMGHLPT